MNVNKHTHPSAIVDLVSRENQIRSRQGVERGGGRNREIRPDSRAERGVQIWGLIIM